MAEIGNLSFQIGAKDDLKKILDEDKKLAGELQKILSNVKVGDISKAFEKTQKTTSETVNTIKQLQSESAKVGTIDLSANINKLVDKLRVARSEMDLLMKMHQQEKGLTTAGELAYTKEYAKATEGANRLMAQIVALENAQKNLNKSGWKNTPVNQKSISDEGELKKMAAYYSQMERESAQIAKNNAKAAAQAEKIALANNKATTKGNYGYYSMADERTLGQMKTYYQQLEKTSAQHDKTSMATLKNAEAQRSLANQSGLTNKTMFSQHALLQQLSAAAGMYFSIYQVGAFVKQLYQVSGEFETQRISLKAILQDSAAAEKIFSQVKSLSVVSPFTFKDLIGYTKQLSAFSIPANELFDTMKRLSDVSAGLGVDMSRIVLAFGQVKSASVLRGQELRQFTEAGIPLVDELAKKFGILENRVVSAGEVFDKISNREVPFAMVKEVFDDLTSAGGKFYEMQEKQAQSLTGKLSNLKDAFQIALSNIGEANDGILKGSIEGITALVNNWQEVLKVLGAIIAAYGTYKAVMVISSIANSQFIASLVLQSGRLAMITAEMGAATAAQYALNTAVSLNPWVIAGVAIAAVVGGLILFNDHTKSAIELTNDLNASIVGLENSNTKVNELTNQYKELKKTLSENADGSAINEAAQKKLKLVLEELAKVVPETAKQFDEYGNILGVNTDVVDQYTANQSKLSKHRVQIAINETKDKINAIKEEMAGEKMRMENGWNGRKFGDEGFKAIYDSYKKNEADIKRLEQSLSDAYAAIQKYNADNWSTVNTDTKSGLSKYFDLTNDYVSQTNKKIHELDWAGMVPPTARKTAEPTEGTTINKEYWEGIITDAQKVLDGLNPKNLNAEQKKSWDINVAAIRNANKELKAWNIETEKKTTSHSSTRDIVNENLKARIALIKEAYSEYEKLKNAGFSAEEAAATVKSKPVYGNITLRAEDGGLQTSIANVLAEKRKQTEGVIATVRDENKGIQDAQLDRLAKNKEILTKELEQYATYTEKYKKIADEDAKARGLFGNDPERLKMVDIATKSATDSLDKEVADHSAALQSWMNGIIGQSLESLKTMLSNAKLLLVNPTNSNETNAVLKAKVAELEKQIADLINNPEKDGGKKAKSSWSGTLKVMNQVSETTKNIISDIDGLDESTKTMLTAATNVAGGVIAMITGIQSLGNQAKVALTGVEKASIILAIIGAAFQIVNAIVNAFSAAATAKYEQAIERLERRVKKLTDAYNDLADAEDRAQGADKYSYTGAKAKNLQDQIVAYDALIAKEKERAAAEKKSDDAWVWTFEKIHDEAWYLDDEKVSGWEDARKKAADELAVLYEDVVNETIGTADELASQLSDAMFEAFSNGEDAAEAWGKKVDEIVGRIVKNMIVAEYITPKIKALIETYSPKWQDGNGNFDPNLFNQTANQFGVDLKGIGSDGQVILETLNKLYPSAATSDGSSSITGIKKDLASASEGTMSLVGSYMNAIRADVAIDRMNIQKITDKYLSQDSVSINSQAVKNIIEGTQPIAVNLGLQLAHLKNIEANTLRSANSGDKIAEILDAVTSPAGIRKLNVR